MRSIFCRRRDRRREDVERFLCLAHGAPGYLQPVDSPRREPFACCNRPANGGEVRIPDDIQLAGAGRYSVSRREIDLGKLPPFEYGQLRAALNYAVAWCVTSAEGYEHGQSEEDRRAWQLWIDRASEMRAIRARFDKLGRRAATPVRRRKARTLMKAGREKVAQ